MNVAAMKLTRCFAFALHYILPLWLGEPKYVITSSHTLSLRVAENKNDVSLFGKEPSGYSGGTRTIKREN